MSGAISAVAIGSSEHLQTSHSRSGGAKAKIARLPWIARRRIEAPEQAHPHGRFTDLADALAAFEATRAEVVRWVENCTRRSALHDDGPPLIVGPVTCAETLIMIAAHPARHAEQIAEIRA